MANFVHLHVHSHYSLLDGMSQVPQLVKKAVADGMKAMALTDHGNMFGIKEFVDSVGKINEDKYAQIDALKDQLKSCAEEEKVSLQQQIEDVKKSLFKPIIGCEVYCARRSHLSKDKDFKIYNKEKDKEIVVDRSGYHLILLAKNSAGYHSLCKLVSKAWVDGFYQTPRIDKQLLEQYHDGLIVCSACLGGEVPQLILNGDIEGARASVRWFKSLFGDDYYLELQRHRTDKANANQQTYQRQMAVNKVLMQLAEEEGIKCVATNDVHFVNEEHADAHQYLIAMQTRNGDISDDNMAYTKQEWFKTQQEMTAAFEDIPQVLENTLEIADKVEIYSINHDPIMPVFEIPTDFGTEQQYRQTITHEQLFDEFTNDYLGNKVLSQQDAEKKIKKLGGYDRLYRIKLEGDYLKKLAFEGAKVRYGDPLQPEIEDRINFELHIMKTMGFPGYFLIVQDFIKAARNMGVSVGPGRGSAAGSVVAYCLTITDIDPLKYDLLFERFLNPDRISLPDIDIDFDDDGRAEVLKWVTEKYGEEKVAHIVTFGTMASKSSIKDVSRILGINLQKVNEICALVPAKFDDSVVDEKGKAVKVNLANCKKYLPIIDQTLGTDQTLKTMWQYASMLEGTIRQTGVHACGVIIGADDLTKFAPVATATDKETGEKLLVTQYEGSVVESVGLIKMDFLGLKTLSIIKDTIRNIKSSRGIDVDIDTIPIDDPETYKLFCDGRTIATFQFESPGMQKYLRELQPSKFEDLIAMNALYRPGPMDYIPDFIERKKDPTKVQYDIPCMEQYLKDTYGITVYQEQVMLLSRLLANFTRGESDALRKAMGKKKIDIVNKMEKQFIEGGKKNGHDEKILQKIYNDWKKFASYAFNKSHATCYSWVAYQTAYLKAHYPSEFMAANLTRAKDSADLTHLLNECQSMKIKVLGPNVNESQLTFSVNKRGEVRFGMGGIKGVGAAVVNNIISEREANGPYLSIFDFIERVPPRTVNRKTMESLILSGALDCFEEISREDYFYPTSAATVFIDDLLSYANRYQLDKNDSTITLFDDMKVAGTEIPRPKVPTADKWSDIERLGKEKEMIGLYLSAHPLDKFALAIKYVFTPIKDVIRWLAEKNTCNFRIGGFIVEKREMTSKNGDLYAFIKLQDYESTIEIPIWPKSYETFGHSLKVNSIVVLSGSITTYKSKVNNEERCGINITSLERMTDEIQSKLLNNITISIPLANCNSLEFREEFDKLILDNEDKQGTPLTIAWVHPTEIRPLLMASSIRVRLSNEFIFALEELQHKYYVQQSSIVEKVEDDDFEEDILLPTEMDSFTIDEQDKNPAYYINFRIN